MPDATYCDSQSFKFLKVEDYFSEYNKWYKLENLTSHTFDSANKILSFEFPKKDGSKCLMVIHFPRKDTFRLRFNPGKHLREQYTIRNTRSVVMDTFGELRHTMLDFDMDFRDYSDRLELTSMDNDKKPFMKMTVYFTPFQMNISRFDSEGEEFAIMSDSNPGIYYTGNGNDNYSIIQSMLKPVTAKYIGFGEQGGISLYKNTAQLTYFNYDNMIYKQVYGRGAFDDREPLYHSNPFFMEFNGVPSKESIYGIFIDNPSEVLVDVGCINSKRYMFGTRFGDLDYYFFAGDSCADIMDAYTSFVGKARLKPRYALGYHQGCYGYDNREKLEKVAENYRNYRIPIDGLHIDVDLQKNYQTFTIDEERFPNPQQMFANLKDKGFKCSTNITPIISNKDENYQTYKDGLVQDFFIKDYRVEPENQCGKQYQFYSEGKQSYYYFNDREQTYNTGKPYIGEVYYGTDPNGIDRGTTGHYLDLGRKEVRYWWGSQFKYLFQMGIEMIWQDMTTPSIRDTRGDMRSFPFRLLITDDFIKAYITDETDTNTGTAYMKSPAITIWNLYSYNLHKATYHGINNIGISGRENVRNFIIGRGSFTGMHRFAGLWAGDNASSWEFLQISVPQVLALGISGQAIAGSDVGGFEGGVKWKHWQKWIDPELLIRWTVAGAFLPWFRNHYIAKDRKDFQEPYAYQSINLENIPEHERYLYTSVLPVCKYYVELRYRLMQLFYDAMFENTINGMPICRAMFLNDYKDKSLYNDKIEFLNNQFFVGRDFLVAPFMEKQAEENGFGKRNVYLPAGSSWYSFMDNRKPLLPAIEGGTTIFNYDAHIHSDPDHIGFIVPLYVRAGAIIPTIELEQYVGELNKLNKPNPITINIYPDTQARYTPSNIPATYTMYLDDGISRSSAPRGESMYGVDPMAGGEYRETRISHKYVGSNLREVKIERIHDKYTPMEKYFFIAVLHDPGETGPLKRVEISGVNIDFISGDTPENRAAQLQSSSENAWYYNENIKISFIKVFDNSSNIPVLLEYYI